MSLVWENIQTKAPFSATFAIRVWPSKEATTVYHLWQEILSPRYFTGTLRALPSYETLTEILVPLNAVEEHSSCVSPNVVL
jgi:hypothetical protein